MQPHDYGQAEFVEFDILVPAVLRVDVADPDFRGDSPEKLAEYLCEEFVHVDFLDTDAAFPGWSDIEGGHDPIQIRRREG